MSEKPSEDPAAGAVPDENTPTSGETQTYETASTSSAATTEATNEEPCTTETPSKDQKQEDSEKIDVILKATGDAPIMKKKRWAIVNTRTVGWIASFLKKFIKLPETDTLFLYVNQTYAPAPDEILENLYDCFGSEGKLVLHYSRTEAWG